MLRRLAWIVALALGIAAGASASTPAVPTLHFKLFAATHLRLGEVVWTGRSFLYSPEGAGVIETSDTGGGNFEPFARFDQNGEEMRCAPSLGRPYWPAGLYCHTPDNRVVRFSLTDSSMTVVARLPASAGRGSDGALAFDNVGHFGHRLLVASGGSSSNGGRIYGVDATGKVSLVGSYAGPGGADNVAVAPPHFGVAAGSLLIAIDHRAIEGRLLAMDSHGAVTVLASGLGTGLNPLVVIRQPAATRPAGAPAPGFYFGDTFSKNVYVAPAASLRPYVGDVIVGDELKARFWIVRPSGPAYVALPVRTNLPSRGWALEGAAYVP
jgi:hypothetical protein